MYHILWYSSSPMKNSPHGAVYYFLVFWKKKKLLHNFAGWHIKTTITDFRSKVVSEFFFVNVVIPEVTIMYKKRSKVSASHSSSQSTSTLAHNVVASTSVPSMSVASTLSSLHPVTSHTENIDPGVSPAKKRVNCYEFVGVLWMFLAGKWFRS